MFLSACYNATVFVTLCIYLIFMRLDAKGNAGMCKRDYLIAVIEIQIELLQPLPGGGASSCKASHNFC